MLLGVGGKVCALHFGAKHFNKNLSALEIITSISSDNPKLHRSAYPHSVALFNAEDFMPTLFIESQPVKACTAGKISTISVSKVLSRLCIGIRVFDFFQQ